MDEEDLGSDAVDVGVDEPADEVRRRRRIPSPRAAALALVITAVGLTTAAWISKDDPTPDVRVSAADDSEGAVTTPDAVEPATELAVEPEPTSTTVLTEVTSTSSAPAPRARTATSGSRTTAPPTTGAAVPAPSWEIFLHDVSASPTTVSPGQTVTFTWRLVSEIGIAQTFVYLSWPDGSSSFPSPSDDCPHFRVVPPVSGDDHDGVYRVTCRIPADTAPATYRVNVMARHHHHDAGDAQYFFDRAQFTVTAPPSTTTTTTP